MSTFEVPCGEVALAEAVAEYPAYGGDSLAMASCGLATLLLQRHLSDGHDINLSRIHTRLDVRQPNSTRGYEHVMLQDQGGTKVDPTHAQFMSLFGVDTRQGDRFGIQLRHLLPESRIAVIPAGDGEKFAQVFADWALGQRAAILASLAQMEEATKGRRFPYRTTEFNAPLLDADEDRIRAVFSRLWGDNANYEPYEAGEDYTAEPYVQRGLRILDEACVGG